MDRTAAITFVNKAVAEAPVVVFSKTFCPFCDKAKVALRSVMGKLDYKLYELDQMDDASVIQDALNDLTGGRTVPRVFVGGKFIGGGDDTAHKAKSGELKKLLTDAGVDV